MVAAEVRALAERSQSAATEIMELANSSTAIAENAGQLLTRLVPDIQKTAELVQEISAASREQTAGTQQINKAVQQLDNVIQQNSATSEEFSAMAGQLAGQSETLLRGVGFFTVAAEPSTELPPQIEKSDVQSRRPSKKEFSAGAGIDMYSEFGGSDEEDEEFERY
ncbi:MAG: hypothetical protein GY801_12410 [bacterium]|nr:hypothetical protein [bacterium]